jgi:hypothetical protein
MDWKIEVYWRLDELHVVDRKIELMLVGTVDIREVPREDQRDRRHAGKSCPTPTTVRPSLFIA